MSKVSRVVIEATGDMELTIQNHQFIVSSSAMSATSPRLQELIDDYMGPLPKAVELPNEDPAAFHMICLSAHGSFIPQAHISMETLVRMADAIRRYKIPSTSGVYNVVVFCFVAHTFRPGSVSTKDLLKLLQVAKSLGSVKLRQLLGNVFVHRPLDLTELPIEFVEMRRETDCAILLGTFTSAALQSDKTSQTKCSSKCDVEKCSMSLQGSKYTVGACNKRSHPPPTGETQSSCLDFGGES
tara:strand:- start:9163 stop:9885 length:723 start_codon:yes stop_codon:yes gene_type:complete